MKRQLDIRGEVCPTLFVNLKKEVEKLQKKEILEVTLKDKDLKDIMAWIKSEGYQISDVFQEGEVYRLTLKK